jgi:hypothetical protein
MSTSVNPDILVGCIAKNANEEVRVQIRKWKGFDLVDVRTHYRSAVGDHRPSKEGISLRLEKLPEFAAIITEAEAEAKRLRLLPGGEK